MQGRRLFDHGSPKGLSLTRSITSPTGVAGQEHRSTAAWRHQALLMLAEWSARNYPKLEAEIDEGEQGVVVR
jgi:hypothetical protein